MRLVRLVGVVRRSATWSFGLYRAKSSPQGGVIRRTKISKMLNQRILRFVASKKDDHHFALDISND